MALRSNLVGLSTLGAYLQAFTTGSMGKTFRGSAQCHTPPTARHAGSSREHRPARSEGNRARGAGASSDRGRDHSACRAWRDACALRLGRAWPSPPPCTPDGTRPAPVARDHSHSGSAADCEPAAARTLDRSTRGSSAAADRPAPGSPRRTRAAGPGAAGPSETDDHSAHIHTPARPGRPRARRRWRPRPSRLGCRMRRPQTLVSSAAARGAGSPQDRDERATTRRPRAPKTRASGRDRPSTCWVLSIEPCSFHTSGLKTVQFCTAQSASRSSSLIFFSGLSTPAFMMPRWGSTR